MLKTLLFNGLLLTTTLFCVSSAAGPQQEKRVEDVPVSIELAARDQPPDAESISALRNSVAEVVQALRNGQPERVYEMLAPEIRRAVPFYEFRDRFGVGRNQKLNLPEDLPEPDFSRVRDRVAKVFIMQKGDATKTAAVLALLRTDHRWFLRSIVVYDSPSHSFHYSGGLISPGSTQQDLIKIKESMLQKALLTGKDWGDPDGFPDVHFLKPSIPVFVETDLDLRADSQIHVPGWTIQVVSKNTAIARAGPVRFFEFESIQIFGDLVLGSLRLSHPAFTEGGGRAEMWLIRAGNLWRFYRYDSQEIF